jgi:hypothetical protein
MILPCLSILYQAKESSHFLRESQKRYRYRFGSQHTVCSVLFGILFLLSLSQLSPYNLLELIN